MTLGKIKLTDHARQRAALRGVTLSDIADVLTYGRHVDGCEAGTSEAYAEIDGKPLTVVYDSLEYELYGVTSVITVIRRACE